MTTNTPDAAGAAPASTAVAVMTPPAAPAPAREIRVVVDPLPILDTARFEHMQRVAQVMAETSMIPDTLRVGKDDKGKEIELPRHRVIANCFMVVNQAVRWGMDPFAVAQCCSVVHGRLMYEGKLVAAVIDARLGIKLAYEFNNKSGRALGVTVSGTLPGETTPRTIEGTVEDWHRGDKSPWAREGHWRRQLRYMGAREWARAHAPAIMLGVLADDEMIEETPRRLEPVREKPVTIEHAPDIPDDDPPPPAAKAAAKSEPTPTVIPSEFLDKLADDRALCDSADDLADLAAANADTIATLPEADAKRAREILSEDWDGAIAEEEPATEAELDAAAIEHDRETLCKAIEAEFAGAKTAGRIAAIKGKRNPDMHELDAPRVARCRKAFNDAEARVKRSAEPAA